MRKRVAIPSLIASVAGLLAVGLTPAQAALSDCTGSPKFCSWNAASYSGAPFHSSTGTYSDNTLIDIADDIMSSGANKYSTRRWCSWTAGAGFNVLLQEFAPNTNLGTVNGNDQADYYRVRTGGC